MSPTIPPIKQINRNQIYRYISQHTKVSQQDISSDLKLSMPTINQNLECPAQHWTDLRPGHLRIHRRQKGQSNFLCEETPGSLIGL